ncbi:hypothetical protein [Polyangium spumosum]|uniref:IcmF-related N-terminal domain-containing protein n=1 Tax=Polyangium spumosum TaxID=889282 RepID=A0A6N7PKI8_9BACT|nr:hypothetical protein [Polyangium spumosum]MRG92573.1 hypothetical protein [Polyangium spumosum]
MQQAAAQAASLSPWVIAAIALVGVLLLVVGTFLFLRARKKSGEEAPRLPSPRSLGRVWGDFVRRLPESVQGAPIVVVLGERRAGKTSAIQAGLARSGSASQVAPSDTSDARLSMFAGQHALVQEISGELLEDTRPEARASLSDLWKPVALRVPVVLFVIDARSTSFTPAGLRRLGALGRDVVDRLTSLRRGRAPRVRVVLSHLDERLDGFVPLARVAEDEGHAAQTLKPAGRRAADLEVLLAPLEPCLSSAIKTLPAAQTAAVTKLLAGGGGSVFAALEPFLDALVGSATQVATPALDGIVVAGLPEGADAGMVGEPLGLDAQVVQSDFHAHEQRRTLGALVVGASIAGLIGGLYLWHWQDVKAAPGAVENFLLLRPPRHAALDGAEEKAGEALRAALRPRWWPLRWAYPNKKEEIDRPKTERDGGGARERFLQKIRDVYLLPAAKEPSLPVRLYAVALLRASEANDLGELALNEKETFARVLGVPGGVVDDYVTFSYSPWRGAIEGLDQGIPRGDWDGFLGSLDESLKKGAVPPEEIGALSESARRLSDALAGVDDAPSQKELESLLRAESPEDASSLLGPGGSHQIPDWAQQRSEELEGLFGEVDGSKVEVPSAENRTLRQIVTDLEGMKCPAGDAASKETFSIDKNRVYRAEDWDRLVASSKSSAYVKAFVDDVRAKQRSPFFGPNQVFPAVGASDMPGRGPSRPLPGLYTARAVNDELVPAFTKLDGALTAACVAQAQRDELARLVRDGMDQYATAYQSALFAYVQGFGFSSGSLASLRTDLQDMATPNSWFGQFWTTVAENAAVDPGNDPNLMILRNALRSFDAIVALQPEKGKPVNLEKYYAILTPLIASLEDGPLAAAGAPLGDRLPLVGKLGLSLLDPDPKHPMPQVKAWLDAAKIPGGDMRRPFLLPMNQVYEYALTNVEKAVDKIYKGEIRPLAAPLWARFPFLPTAKTDAPPGEVDAVFGAKGTMRLAFNDGVAPAARRSDGGAWVAKRPLDYRAVALPKEALEAGGWLDGLLGLLWDEAGKAKALALSVRPLPLPKVERDDRVAVTMSSLSAGETTVAGFNQAPAWKPLPVIWSTSTPAVVSVEWTDLASGGKTSRSQEGTGEFWQALRLVCEAPASWRGATLSWMLGARVAFDVSSDPWEVLLPPPNRASRCPSRPPPPKAAATQSGQATGPG